MEYKGYKIESIKNDGHLQRNAFGIYKNGKLISTATTSKEAQHEVDNIMNRPVTIEYIIVNKKNDSKSRETIKATESDVDKKIKELERKYSNDKTYYLRDIRKVYDMRDRDPFAYEVIKKDIELAKAGKASYITKGSLIRRITYSYSNRTPQSGGITTEQKNELMSLLSGVKDSCEMKTIDKLNNAIKTLDASRGHEVVVYANQALSEMGKNNSVGKYDRVVMGVRSILGNSLLPSNELKKAVKREVERLLKKYNLD